MGAWGHGPLDNDDAGDLTDTLLSPLLKKFNSRYELEARAAIYMFVQIHKIRGWKLDYEHKEAAIARLTQILNDKQWIDDWTSPATITRLLKKEISEIKRMKTV